MWQQGLKTFGVAFSLLSWVANGLYLPSSTADDCFLEAYDYIVVGGGASGLVIANRLSEDASVNVLVLEAGTLDTEGSTVVVPTEVGEDLGTAYELQTAPQEFLAGRTITLNQGKVLGGGTVLNGMVWTRSTARDYDVWVDLNNVLPPAAAQPKYSWRWAHLLPYFQKSENFTAAVGDTVREALGIQPGESVHGGDGLVQVEFAHFYQRLANFLQGMKVMGVSTISEQNGGTMNGAFVAPSIISAANQSRLDARVAYLDKMLDRPNLHVASEQMVSRILLEKGAKNSSQLQNAVGVEVASATITSRNISCTKEVIRAAGAIFSPTLLQISAIGPRDVLESLDILSRSICQG